MLSLFSRISNCIYQAESRILVALGLKYPPGNFAVNVLPTPCKTGADKNGAKSILENILVDGFLLAVPRFRRTVEVRMTRKMAKIYKPIRSIIVCNLCGHHHQGHTICGNCYSKVREETNAIQEAIRNKWKLNPINKEVSIIYKNEKPRDEFGKGALIVEMPHERPQWFSDNLLAKENSDNRTSTVTNIQTINTEIKPAEVHDKSQ